MSLRTMEQTWMTSSIFSRIVVVAKGNQPEITDVITSLLINCKKEHGMPKWNLPTKLLKTTKYKRLKRLRLEIWEHEVVSLTS